MNKGVDSRAAWVKAVPRQRVMVVLVHGPPRERSFRRSPLVCDPRVIRHATNPRSGAPLIHDPARCLSVIRHAAYLRSGTPLICVQIHMLVCFSGFPAIRRKGNQTLCNFGLLQFGPARPTKGLNVGQMVRTSTKRYEYQPNGTNINQTVQISEKGPGAEIK